MVCRAVFLLISKCAITIFKHESTFLLRATFLPVDIHCLHIGRKKTSHAFGVHLHVKHVVTSELIVHDDLLALANQKAAQLKKDKLTLYERMEDLKRRRDETSVVVNLAKSWKNADYPRKKAVAMIMIHRIIISEDGSVKIEWNI